MICKIIYIQNSVKKKFVFSLQKKVIMKYIKYTIFTICFLSFLSSNVLAERVKHYEEEPEELQDPEEEEEEKGPWVFMGVFSQVFNQASFTNWAAGGENTYASSSIVGLEANYTKDNLAFENNLDLRYGLYKAEEQSARKNEDWIDFTSKFGREISEKLNASTMINYRSQFTAGYNYPNDSIVVSRFMAPGFLTISLGLDYKPWDFLSIFISPVTGRFTFVLDEELSGKGAFGVDTANNVKSEIGGMVTFSFNKRFTDNIRVRSKLDVFNTYSTPDMEGWLNSVVNWETTIRLKITEYITMNLLFHMIYDHDISVPVYETINGEEIIVGEEHLQFMQTFGLGFSFSF